MTTGAQIESDPNRFGPNLCPGCILNNLICNITSMPGNSAEFNIEGRQVGRQSFAKILMSFGKVWSNRRTSSPGWED